MRTKHPWFGPKKSLGWGWTPASWEGWAVTALCFAVIGGAYLVYGAVPMAAYVTIGAVVALLVVCILTGTPPG